MTDTGKTWKETVMTIMAVVVMMALIGVTEAQGPDNCDVISSPAGGNEVDVQCNCMQQLQQVRQSSFTSSRSTFFSCTLPCLCH